jgi:hypothetical protein
LLFILVFVYFRLCPTQEVLGFLFGFGQPQANYWIHWLTPILNAALGYEMQLPERQPADLEEVRKACPELQFILDCSSFWMEQSGPFSGPKTPSDEKITTAGRRNGTQ